MAEDKEQKSAPQGRKAEHTPPGKEKARDADSGKKTAAAAKKPPPAWLTAMTNRLGSWAHWQRGLFMLGFGILFYFCFAWLIWILVLFQFLAQLLVGKINPQLLELSERASSYAEQILRYVTYQTEERPWPFGKSPQRARRSSRGGSRKR